MLNTKVLRARFLGDPKAVLAEHGIDVPENMNVTVLENTDVSINVTMPKAPEGAAGLTLDELNDAADARWQRGTLGCE